MADFAAWQKSECQAMGISIEDHNRILEIAQIMNMNMGTSGAYSFLRNLMIVPISVSDLELLDKGLNNETRMD